MIIPDVNLLLYAINDGAVRHADARRWWQNLLSGSERVGLAAPVLVGFLRLSTKAHLFRQPLEVTDATALVRSWLRQPSVQVLTPRAEHMLTLCTLLDACGAAGNLASDAHLAAFALEYGGEIHSADTDFARFPGVRWRNPLQP